MTSASCSPLAGSVSPAGQRFTTVVARALLGAGVVAGFFAGVAVGFVLERDRPFGARYWQAEAQQAWRLRDLVIPREDGVVSKIRSRQLDLARTVESAVRAIDKTYGHRPHPDTPFFGTQM